MMRNIIFAQIMTGHIDLPERGCDTVIIFLLFFSNRNVIETVSANKMKSFDLSFSSVLFLKKRMSLTVSLVVFCVPSTFRYSQLRIPKKKAAVAS